MFIIDYKDFDLQSRFTLKQLATPKRQEFISKIVTLQRRVTAYFKELTVSFESAKFYVNLHCQSTMKDRRFASVIDVLIQCSNSGG